MNNLNFKPDTSFSFHRKAFGDFTPFQKVMGVVANLPKDEQPAMIQSIKDYLIVMNERDLSDSKKALDRLINI